MLISHAQIYYAFKYPQKTQTFLVTVKKIKYDIYGK